MIRTAGYRGRLADAADLAGTLAAAGLSEPAVQSRARLFATVAGALGAEPQAAFHVPGRIEVLGKHTDYAGGRTLVAAAERGFALAVRPRDDGQIGLCDVRTAERADFPFRGDVVPRAGHWLNYPMSVARRLAGNFPGELRGAEIAWASDLPPAAGMSSSSAFMVGIFLALDAVNHFTARPEFQANIAGLEDLAGYLATLENGQTFGTLAGDRGVGTFGGSEDHTAILGCHAGSMSEYSYCPVVFRRAIPLPAGYTLAVGASGVVAEKTGAARELYNAASRKAAALVALWRQASGGPQRYLAEILAGGPAAAEELRRIVAAAPTETFASAALLVRLEHFLAEDGQFLPAAGDALARGDLAEFGQIVDRSQEAAERLLGNQVAETVDLARLARAQGAAAASSFGAGFGGSVWALVESAAADDFLARWSAAYHQHYPQHAASAAFFLTAAGPAAFRL